MAQNRDHEKTIAMTEQEVTWLVAAVLLMVVFSFVGGVYYGKWQAAADVVDHIERESFADRVYYALAGGHIATGEEEEYDTAFDENNDDDMRGISDNHDTVGEEAKQHPNAERVPEPEPEQPHYKAQLAGFGTRKAAYAYYTKLKNRGFAADIDERLSTTKKGKHVTWFQVVIVDTKDALTSMVERLKKDDKLTNVPIVHV